VQEAGEEMRVVDLDGKLDQDVLESKFRLLDAVSSVSLVFRYNIYSWNSYLSLVNLPSLYAAMKLGLSLYAFNPKLPAELLVMSNTSDTVFSSVAFW
jgi:hypothetical protein